MRSLAVAATLAGLSLAAPAPALSSTDLSVVKAHPKPALTGPPIGVSSDPPKYDSDAAADAAEANPVHGKRDLGSKVKRDACAAQPAGAAPTTSPDTDSAFLNNPTYDSTAENAAVPDGYSQSFSNLHGSVEGVGYLGFFTLQSYDPIACQAKCDAADGCQGINVFIERDPSKDPGDACPNPPSTANYRCSLWGAPVSSGMATNQGQWRDQFHVVIAASNGYVKNAPPPSVDDFTGPTELGGAIQAPVGSYIGAKFFDVYDPSQCGAACEATTQYDHDHLVHSDGTYDACNFVNVYELSKNGVPQGMYCAMYKQAWGKSYSTNTGFTSGSDRYTISQSYGYTLSTQDPGHT